MFGLTLTIRRLALSLCTVAALAALAGCGSAASTSASPGASGSAQYQARLSLAKCMRSNGVDVPDPSSSGGGIGEAARGALRNYPQVKIQAALKACSQYVAKAFPRLALSAAQRAQLQQQLVKFAECMRSHGVNVPDPTFNNNGGPGLGFGFRRAFGSVDRNSPAFRAAATACATLRPRFGRGGPGGPGPAGPGAAGGGGTSTGTSGA